MNKADLKNVVKSTIKIFMEKGMAYTSVDICNNVRSLNPTYNITMKSISKMVRKYSLDISTKISAMYEVTYISVDTGNMTKSYLYHPEGYDTDDYMSRDQTPLQTLDNK